MLTDFELAGARMMGREHRKGVPRNCQDAYHIKRGANAITAFTSDGCGSGADSEVGANIALCMLTALLHRHIDSGRSLDNLAWRRLQQELLSQLHVLARTMGESLSEVVHRYFLFTLVGVVITEQNATFVAIGDGVIIINGEVIILEPENQAQNEPVYLGYALTGSRLTERNPELLQFRPVRTLPTGNLRHFLVGTDGVNDFLARAADNLPGKDEPLGDISQLWESDRYFDNAAALTLRLNLAARDWQRRTPSGRYAVDGGLLGDDTALIVGRRRLHSES